MINFSYAVKYPLQDQRLLPKLGIALLISLVPILGTVVMMGWGQEIVHRVVKGRSELLPGFEDFGLLVKRGIKFLLVYLAYILPIFLLSAISMLFISAKNIYSGGFIAILAGISVFPIMMLLSAATARLASTGNIKHAFEFAKIADLYKGLWMKTFLTHAFSVAIIYGLTFIDLLFFRGAPNIVLYVLTTINSLIFITIQGCLSGQVYNIAVARKKSEMAMRSK